MQGILPDSRKSYLLEENPTFARTFPTLGGIFSYLGGIFSYLKVGFFAFFLPKGGIFFLPTFAAAQLQNPFLPSSHLGGIFSYLKVGFIFPTLGGIFFLPT